MYRQIKAIYSRGNVLVREFKLCSDDVKRQLFQSYCTSFYRAQLWCNYSAQTYRKVKVAYNNTFRHLMGIKGPCSISQLFLEHNVHCYNVLMRKLVNGFMTRILASQNILISVLVNSLYFLSSSEMHKKWANLLYSTTSQLL